MMTRAYPILPIVLIAVLASSACAAGKTDLVRVKTSADSEALGYESYKAMDGNPRTMWHTAFGAGETRHPHEIIFDLGKSREISGMVYLPRADMRNGTIKDFELFVSDDSRNFRGAVVKGTFTKEAAENTVKLSAPAKGRYVKLRALSEVNGRPWTSIAELRLLTGGVKFRAVESSSLLLESPTSELELQYEILRRDITNRKRISRHAEQALVAEALILDSDRDPLDVILRRTAALLGDLMHTSAAQRVAPMATELKKLQRAGSETAVTDAQRRLELFKRAYDLRRRIALSNPLLDFDEIVFIKRHRATFNHMCDQYYGINILPGGGIYVLSDPFGEKPRERNVLTDSVVQRGRLKGQRLTDGSFLSSGLSYDGKIIVFAHVECKGDRNHRYHTDPSRGHWNKQRCYHIFKVNVDGSGLEQLTDGTWNDFDPCWLPNGRIAFISERRGGYLRCGRVCPTYTLHDMNADGSDIRCLSLHETNEWHPSVTHDGRIIYTRWDYVDRHGCTAHLPWITTPDGRDARAVHGNFAPRELRADMELDVRAIPGSHKFVATGAPHHGQAFGSLVIFDPYIEDDDVMGPVKRITPEVDFPETQGGAQVYGTPWPLSEKYFLCVYDPTMPPNAGRQGRPHLPGRYGIYLLDVFGNKELIYRDPEIACLSPSPLRARPKPAVIPDESIRVAAGEPAEATLAVVNVYDTLKPWPETMKVKSLRVYQILPMTVPSGAPPHETSLREPTAGDSVVLTRYVLGTVPVEEDGSAHFTVPARKELFFQILDEDGLAIQSMRSATYLQPGEQLVCQGCHEPRHRAPGAPSRLPKAMTREPSKLKAGVDGTNPFSYPRLVQPVLDKHCAQCHADNPEDAPRLDSEVIAKGNGGRQRWYTSYHSLAPEYGFWSYGGRHRTIPGKFGARVSKLYKLLQEGHYDVKLSEEEMHRIVVWLDSCSIFYGVYEKEGGIAQLQGKVVYPTLE
ncbi:MAG: discoidin domain-containing protein [Phycisphaerales bacterium]|nr:MAG: discoidin domain-containing protein [Phycisphaerales bacterium]